MYLKDTIDSKFGLQEDEWSGTKPRFGSNQQLEVIGWSGRQGTAKLYIVKCSICCRDEELFGDGFFVITKSVLQAGTQPCGCSNKPRWSKEQYATLCKRKATNLGYDFIGFEGSWKGCSTKISMYCAKHGVWSSGVILSLLNSDKGCPGCRTEVVRNRSTKPDNVMIESFFASGAFHPQTKFWRSERETINRCKIYWHMSCPECGNSVEGISSHLQKGKRPCMCSRSRQKEAYINIIYDAGKPLALKFGIANNSNIRLKTQGSRCIYNIRQYGVWIFPNKTSCLQAELECKQSLVCGIIGKQEMPDGRTETTYLYNLERVIEIYEKHGGLKREEDISSGH